MISNLYIDQEKKLIVKKKTEYRVSVYDAIELIKYHNYLYKHNSHFNIYPERLIDLVKVEDIEDYGWTIVINSNNITSDICNELNIRNKDYILQRKQGKILLYHKSSDTESLKREGYKPNQERIDTGGGSFAVGLYAYESNMGREYSSGVYNGTYFKCIFSKGGDGKEGELFFPYNTQNIDWSK